MPTAGSATPASGPAIRRGTRHARAGGRRPLRTLSYGLPALGLLASATALAGGGGGHSDAGSGISPSILVILVLGVAAAYLLAHFVVERLQRRFLLATGVEYILLGVLLGPLVAGLLTDELLTPLGPLIALAVGFIGLTFGMVFNVRELMEIEDRSFRLALLEGLGTCFAVTGSSFWFFRSGLFGTYDDSDAVVAAAVLGCAAWAGSSSAVDVVSRRYRANGPLVQSLRRASRFGDLLAVLAFGSLFCVFHTGLGDFSGYDPGMIEWGVITLALGCALGALFSVFLDARDAENSRLLALSGIITFASGAAFFLELSVLAINAILGVVLTNSRDGKAVKASLASAVRPMTLILLVFAGVLWRPVDLTATLVVVLAYPVLRFVGKVVGCWIASLGTPLRRDMFRGLLAQGDVAVAMAVSARLVFDSTAIDVAYTAILASVLAHEFIAPRLVKGLLVDAGEIDHEVSARI